MRRSGEVELICERVWMDEKNPTLSISRQLKAATSSLEKGLSQVITD